MLREKLSSMFDSKKDKHVESMKQANDAYKRNFEKEKGIFCHQKPFVLLI